MRGARWGLRPVAAADYAEVLIPLEEAHLYSHSARVGRSEFEEPPDEEDCEDGCEVDGRAGVSNGLGRGDRGEQDFNGAKHGEHEGTGMLEMRAAEYSIEGLRREVRKGEKGRQWSAYEMKSKLINKAIQDIGMGRYNWQLFYLCGFGWFADNLWLQGVSLTLPSLSAEFGVSEKTVRYTTSSLFLGLCMGSFFWGIGSDVLGRRIAFNSTLLITGVFGVAASYAPSWGWACALFAGLGFGVGGNLPVDGALFLEFLPDGSSSLLTLLSVWWPIGQLFSSLFAWFFIANWPSDQGWRWFVLSIGAVTLIMFGVRFFAFHLFESPKYLLSRGRQAEAVAVVHGVAYRNGVKTWLTEEILDEVANNEYDAGEAGYDLGNDEDQSGFGTRRSTSMSRGRVRRGSPGLSTASIIRSRLASFSADRIRPLFSNKKLGSATAIMWFCWATIGMGYPLFNAFLPQYLSHGGSGGGSSMDATGPTTTTPTTPDTGDFSSDTYRNYAITSIAGVPGSILAAYTVDHQSPFLGRRGTLAISTLISAVFLFAFVAFGTSPASQLAFSCIEAFSQNIMYGVLYAFTPEIFPAPVRGAGTGVASFLNRVTGLMAPILAANIPGDGATGPIYLSAILILAAFVGMCLIPIETRGRQRL